MPTVLTNFVVGNGPMTPSRPTDSRRCYEFVWRLPARQTTSDSYLIDQFLNSFVRHRKRQTVVCVCLLWIPNINFFDFSDSIFFGFVGQMPAMEMEDRKWRDREALKHIIGQWNANRLDLFSLSEPNEVCWNKTNQKLLQQSLIKLTICFPLFETGIWVPWSDEVLFSRRWTENRNEMHPGLFDGVHPGRDRNSDREIPSRHENVAHGRLRPLRDPPKRWYWIRELIHLFNCYWC